MSERENRFQDLFERNHARWTGISRCYATACERDDLMQEIMLQIWKSFDGFADRSNINTWSYRIALNTALAWDRTSRTRAANLNTKSINVECFADGVVGGAASDSFEMRVLDEFLASLSKSDRAVMLLFLDGAPDSEAAKIVGATEGALRVRRCRIQKKFENTYCNEEKNDDL